MTDSNLKMELPRDLRKFISDAVNDATENSPLIVTSEKFVEAMVAMYVRGVADGRKMARDE